MDTWVLVVFALFILAGMFFVCDIVFRAYTGRKYMAYLVIVPLYWIAFAAFVKLI